MFSSLKIKLFIFSIILLINYINCLKCLEAGKEGCDNNTNKCCPGNNCIKTANGKTKCCTTNLNPCRVSNNQCCSNGICMTSFIGIDYGFCVI